LVNAKEIGSQDAKEPQVMGIEANTPHLVEKKGVASARNECRVESRCVEDLAWLSERLEKKHGEMPRHEAEAQIDGLEGVKGIGLMNDEAPR
jgi:hypothetical protein